MDQLDICIVGAGVIGLAVARELALSKHFAGASIAVLEQEASIGLHCSSRNSEVIHAGIYYPTNSLKSRLCVRGKTLLYDFCDRYQVEHNRIGKHIVAGQSELPQLMALADQAKANGVSDLELLDKEQLQQREPAVSADIALYSPSTGIINSHDYLSTLLAHTSKAGVDLVLASKVIAIEKEPQGSSGLVVSVEQNSAVTNSGNERYRFSAKYVINCAGLGATALASQSASARHTPKLYPCKGDYYGYRGNSPFSTLIYPLPHANLRGLGIHSTLDMNGKLRFGPDAYYVGLSSHDRDLKSSGPVLDYAPDDSKAARFAEAISTYYPDIDASRLYPDYSGIRPKISGPSDTFADFRIEQNPLMQGLIELFGIESPGLTASLGIAEYVLELSKQVRFTG